MVILHTRSLVTRCRHFSLDLLVFFAFVLLCVSRCFRFMFLSFYLLTLLFNACLSVSRSSYKCPVIFVCLLVFMFSSLVRVHRVAVTVLIDE